MSGLGIIFLAVFMLALLGTYIGVRRELLALPVAGLVCAAMTVGALFGFGITQDLELLHSTLMAVFIGLSFTGVILLMAAFFLANQPEELDAYLADREASSD
ncbi:MAG: hypothetical protein ACLFTK_01170 [Anaerolineales bacterium]